MSSEVIHRKIKALVKPLYYGILSLLPAKWHVSLDYLRVYHRLPDLKNPRKFSEKIKWRMLHEHDPRMPDLVDKIKVKEIMAARFGEDFIIPTLRVYDSVEEMDFGRPPLSTPPYVLKANHGSAMNIIVKPGETPDPSSIRKRLAHWLKFDHTKIAREWAYGPVKRKIFAETYIDIPGSEVTDYKFHVFSGKVYAIEVVVGRFTNFGISYYDRNWNRLDITHPGQRYAKFQGMLEPPKRLKNMIERAEAIGRDFSYVRVDLYEINDIITLGELTFYPSAGHDPFHPSIWDDKFGAQWNLEYHP